MATVVISFRGDQSGDEWVRTEAERRGITRTDMYRIVLNTGLAAMAWQEPAGDK